MKKLLLLVFSIAIIVSSSAYSTALYVKVNDENKTFVNSETLKFKIDFPDKDSIKITSKGLDHHLDLEGFAYLLIPGKPMLPAKNYVFALPPCAKVISVEFNPGDLKKLPGSFNILPVESMLLLGSENSFNYKKSNEEWAANYQSVYSHNQAYPKEIGRLTGSGTMRKYSYVSVSVCPFAYFPLSKDLYYYESVELIVNYKEKLTDEIKKILSDTIADEKASQMFTNYEEIQNLYKTNENIANAQANSYDYLLITNDEIKDTVASSDFINWKSSLGFNIRFVTITDPLITSQQGIDLAEQIRNFLRENYLAWGIKYLLIVGDYATVPMRYCSPDPNWLAGTVPTDTYYSDLSYPDSESWNSNQDDYYGVYTQDSPDFAPEIYVGRIPTSDITRISYTLKKITLFEQDLGEWKNNALHGGAMLFYANEDHDEDIDFDIDGARLIDYIEKDLMQGWSYNHYCEHEGLSPSVYPFDALTEQAFTADWRSGKHAVVNWAAHGAPASIGRVIWNWDDGDGIPEHENGELGWGSFLNTYSNLEADYPSIVFAVSCNVGRPEPTPDGNLGIDMLTKETFGSAVAVCSSTRGAAVSADWVVSHSGAEALCYEFNHYMINGPNGPSSLGEALYDSKSYVHYNFGWDHPYEFMNMYDYNLYGDPSMIREGISSSAPSAPHVEGPTSGKVGKDYDYSFRAIDPTDDDIFYYIDWGDGSVEDWIGPYTAGEEITIGHTWRQSRVHNIRAKARDDNGEESGWSTLVVTIPKLRNDDTLLLRLIELLGLTRLLIR